MKVTFSSSGIFSARARPEGSRIRNLGSADHDDPLLHCHHGMGPLLPLHGNMLAKICELQSKRIVPCFMEIPVKGFRSTLPWQSCNSAVLADYSTANCFTKYDNDFCNQVGSMFLCAHIFISFNSSDTFICKLTCFAL